MKPIKTVIKGTGALVTTEITIPDFAKIFSDLLPKLFALALENSTLTSDEINKKENDLFTEYFNENKIETTTVTRDIKVLKEDGWKIDTNSFELFDFPNLE